MRLRLIETCKNKMQTQEEVGNKVYISKTLKLKWKMFFGI